MKRNKLRTAAYFGIGALSLVVYPSVTVHAQQMITIPIAQLLPRADISLSPKTGTFTEGSTFEVPILVNTRGASINGIDIKISFDPKKLAIVQPSNGKSIIGVWVEPPAYDNVRGTASYVGVIPNGVTTSSGLIGTLTFKAKGIGRATISVQSNSTILLNDGLGTNAVVNYGRGTYTIIPKAPEGVIVYSETHPSQDTWYNNNNPVLAWDKEAGVTGFSYVLDDKPSTIPDNTVLTTDTTKAYEKVTDGLWYFHVKAIKNGVWGTTGHFLLRIDTAPPAEFKPQAEYVVAAVVVVQRTLVSFFTTDNLSGIDHYEVGVINTAQPATEAPVFEETISPFQVPLNGADKLRVIVRAIDKAGNVRDASINVQAPFIISKFISDYLTYILTGIIVLALFMLLMHYLFGHKILAHIRRAFAIVEEEEKIERQQLKAPEAPVAPVPPVAEPKQKVSITNEKGNMRWPS